MKYRYKKYVTDADHLKEKLTRYGVAIIPNVLTTEECTEAQEGMWDYLFKMSNGDIKKEDATTWRKFKDYAPLHGMLLQWYGVGHAQFIWNLRTHPKVYGAFAKLWNVNAEDLLVSFDGASFSLPPETTRCGWQRPNQYGLHTDQSFTRNDFECVQSWITAYDVNEGDATLAFLEKSHKLHHKIAKKFDITEKSNWYKIHDEELEYYLNQDCKKRAIKCPAGSMVFWDSRTIHVGKGPDKNREEPNFRCVVYLCYMPRALATATDLKKKIKYYEEKRMTNNRAEHPKVFTKTPRWGVKEYQQIADPQVNEIGRRFIGYEK